MLSFRIAAGAAMAALLVLGTATPEARAGDCPAGKVVASGQGQKPGATKPKGVTDTVIGQIDVAKEAVQIKDRLFRLRRLEIAPGGEVPWHEHKDRPAIIYIVKGTVTEYSSDCAVPIVHKAGDVSAETQGVAHWWKNTGKETVVLISADLLHVASDPNVM